MCVAFGSTRQLGIPLNGDVLSAMDPGAQAFWRDFLQDAIRVIEMMEERGKQKPLIPPDYLREKYRRAVAQYDGRSYCQVRQLETIFAF